jgi:cytoskeletal protein CcmA (bactofilin family)
MALFLKPESPPPPSPPEPEAPLLTRRFTDTTADRLTLLGPGLRVVGEIESEDAVVIAGSFEGQVVTTALFRITESGSVSGSVVAENAALGGGFTGDLEATGKVELAATALVHATLRAHTVAMAEGSAFDGEVHMAEGASPSAFREKRRTR